MALNGIPKSSAFVLNTANPIDRKMKMTDADMYSMSDVTQAYVGMILYNETQLKWKKLDSFPSVTPANWSDFGTGSTPTITTTTTNATPTATTLFTTVSNRSYTVQLTVTATRTGGSAGTAGDAGSYKRQFRVKNLSGTVTLGSIVDVYTDEDQTAWDVTAIVSGLNVQAQLTGATNNNIKWSIETNVVEGTFTP